ncbi:MAG: hypothetical protein SVX43_05850 [Cyanobacteriota bacterium]|nr:hypothetical protein [Cyanobacteriota bacterium]
MRNPQPSFEKNMVELSHFVAWAIAIATVAGVGSVAMVWAYVGSGSTAILFEKTVPLSSSLPEGSVGDRAQAEFSKGCEAFEREKFRQASDRFTRALQSVEAFPEAYHNRGLARANLRQDNEAAIDLAQAGEGYAQQDNPAAIAQIKTQLEAIQARRVDRH